MASCRDEVVGDEEEEDEEDESMDESERYFAVLFSNRLIFTLPVKIQSMETYERGLGVGAKGFRK